MYGMKLLDPGMIFLDRINNSSANPIRADGWEVESTNPCGEQPLYPFDACNLGSIFLGYFVQDGRVEWDRLAETVKTTVRMLDNVIEMNPFPLPQIADTVRKIRRIGLGVGGWADMLVELGIAYDSQEALDLAEKVMKFINEEGHKASRALAEERGAFPMWKESIYKKDPMRNSTVTTIAPTGSIGILANASGGIEPLFAVAYQHIVKSENRTLTFVNPKFEEVAKKRGFYSKDLMDKVAQHGTIREILEIPEDVRRTFGTAHEISPEWHVKMQAAFQKYTDNAVSKTINLGHEATVDEVKKAYMMAWETGCMGITVFRDGSKSEQVLNLGTKKSVQEIASSVREQAIRPRPVKIEGATYRIETPMGVAFITVNHDHDGNPYEVFVTIGKAGSDLTAMAEALGRLVSKFLKLPGGVSSRERVQMIIDQMAGIGGARSVGFGSNKVRSLPDAMARALRMHFGIIGADNGNGNGKHEEAKQEELPLVQMPLPIAKKGDLCPGCGESSLIFEEGCRKCYGCGYSEC
ncbi:MAG: ribonucleoside-diphosphate reductase [Microgenomates group bacterium Gr01-1014_16]|nr:MAG: ribonucleoside-diphosphate reductase [Microgenomates group bacterium Gr01-1014_16]